MERDLMSALQHNTVNEVQLEVPWRETAQNNRFDRSTAIREYFYIGEKFQTCSGKLHHRTIK